MGGLECPEPSWRSILVTIYEVSAFREKASKMEGKRDPKITSKSNLGRPGVSFGRLFEGSDFGRS